MKKLFSSIQDHSFLKSVLNNQSIVVDLGANDCTFSNEVNRIYGSKCYAVEADQSIRFNLRENVKLFNFAISKESKPITFYISHINSEANSVNKFNHLGNKSVTVQGITIQDFLKNLKLSNVDLLKMDIEGSEIEFFESTDDETLLGFKQITIEFHDFIDRGYLPKIEAIKKRLSRLGFINIVFSFPYNQGDVLFINRSLKLPALYWAGILLTKFGYVQLRYVYKIIRDALGLNAPRLSCAINERKI